MGSQGESCEGSQLGTFWQSVIEMSTELGARRLVF